MPDERAPRIGVVIGGSLTRGVEARVSSGNSPILGQYVTAPLDGGKALVGMVTDIMLQAGEPASVAWPPPAGDRPSARLLREVLADTAVYTAAQITPYLELEEGILDPARARSLPRHFAPVHLADQEIVDAAFTTGGDAVHVGSPLGMPRVEVCVDMERLFERSAAVFGKSGTGKTVLTLQILDALLARSKNAPTQSERTVALVFDMHNDYGRNLKFGGGYRRSLRDSHPTDVTVYSLESQAPGQDGSVEIGTRDIQPEDLAVLQTAGHFTLAALEAAHEFHERYGRDWVDELLARDPSEALIAGAWSGAQVPDQVNWSTVAGRLGVHSSSLDNLRRGLRHFERRKVVRSGSSQFEGGLEHIVKTLQGGKSVVVQFGRFGSDLVTYMLVANMLSRRIWDRYRIAVDRASENDGQGPNRLVIVIEEAHKFVDRSLANFSIFGQIARELRKYSVTLLVIDQRPSQIDPEVLSQIGTKFCFQLDSESDVEAMVGGAMGRTALRQVISSLESQQQSLVFGHAVPMPVVVRTVDFTGDRGAGAGLRPAGGQGGSLRERLDYPAREPRTENPLFG
ncbi:MAG TPA: ATP-binding protein [Dehalococcoidia bacterium]|nr:ATP-binding protein [Dehalococcoidia bacterium]